MPALAAVVIGSLGVGIGANSVVFSWVQAVVVQSDRRASARARRFYLVEPKTDAGMYPGVVVARVPRSARAGCAPSTALIAFQMVPLYVGERGRVERSSGLLVSGNYFSVARADAGARPLPAADEVGDARRPRRSW